MLRLTASIAAIALIATAAPAQDAPRDPAAAKAPLTTEQAMMRSHVAFLASDAMRGREAGSPEFDIAAAYVAAQFEAVGLSPAGDDGTYLQKVPLLRYQLADKGSFTFKPARGEAIALEFGTDFAPAANPETAVTEITAPLVFVGYGIDAPSLGRDDYKGVDAKGKIVVFFAGAPKSMSSEPRAHWGRAGKQEAAARHGAVGTLTIETPSMRGMVARSAAGWQSSRITWARADGRGNIDAPGAPNLGTLSLTGAEKLFAGSRKPFAEQAVLAADSESKFKAEQLPGTLSVKLTTTTEPVASYNVAGMLEGSDPKLRHEVVVLSAHLDHVGVGRPDKTGDTIYNGAMDDAVGIASLIEEARRFKESGKPPRRSILFLAVTAEEKGLIGSSYFAHNPTVPKANLVADVNLDMPILTYKFEDVIAFGSDRSTIGPIVRKAAADMGLQFSPDPMPEQSLFVRSDHYRFVQQGIPSVFLWPGVAGPGQKAVDYFFANNYHQPSDHVTLIDWEQGVRFVEINYRIARGIADADQRPLWNKGDYFGLLYDGPGAK